MKIRTVVWIVAVIGWLVPIVYGLVMWPFGHVGAIILGAIGTWVVLGLFLTWRYGIGRRVRRHFKQSLENVHCVKRTIPEIHRIDVLRAMQRIHEELQDDALVVGVNAGAYSDLLQTVANNSEPEPLQFESFEESADESNNTPVNGLYLLHEQKRPYAALLRTLTDKTHSLEVAAPSPEVADGGMKAIIGSARDQSIYRGAVLKLRRGESRGDGYELGFHHLTPVTKEQIVLPVETLASVERNVLSFLDHRETIQASGHGLRRGVLFHGPPGTGKTLLTRYLATQHHRLTVILLTSWRTQMIREAFHHARMLAPAMIVCEDIDMIAAARTRRRSNPVLQELLDEMDGLTPETECVVVLTTNRPEVLEPALAARPGRVDQAIYFPLPDDECRRRLLRLFTIKMDVRGVNIADLVTRTQGASPAFLKELCRKAILFAAMRGETGRVQAQDDDFHNALKELSAGDFTQKLLGKRMEK